MSTTRPATRSPLLLLLSALGCGSEPAMERVLARFDFEDAGWSAHSVCSEEAPHSGSRAFMLAGGFNGSKAYSPLMARAGVDVIDVSWHVRIEALRSPRVQLMLLGYVDRPSEHPAIPEAPDHLASIPLGKYVESLEEWTPQEDSVDVARLMPEADWVRIEVRFFAPKIKGEAVRAGRIFLDDVTVTGRSKG